HSDHTAVAGGRHDCRDADCSCSTKRCRSAPERIVFVCHVIITVIMLAHGKTIFSRSFAAVKNNSIAIENHDIAIKCGAVYKCIDGGCNIRTVVSLVCRRKGIICKEREGQISIDGRYLIEICKEDLSGFLNAMLGL